jgi:hypothetical protein
MGKQSNSKDLRRQIRNVLQEEAKTIAASEVAAQVQKDLLEAQNKRLDQIEEFCKGQLEKQDKRARDVQGFLVGIVKNHLQESLNDMDLTIESLGRSVDGVWHCYFGRAGKDSRKEAADSGPQTGSRC